MIIVPHYFTVKDVSACYSILYNKRQNQMALKIFFYSKRIGGGRYIFLLYAFKYID